MSLFACENCNVIENTALCGFTFDEGNPDDPLSARRVLICSLCNPDIGQWHGLFPREQFDPTIYEEDPNHNGYVRRIPPPGVEWG